MPPTWSSTESTGIATCAISESLSMIRSGPSVRVRLAEPVSSSWRFRVSERALGGGGVAGDPLLTAVAFFGGLGAAGASG